MAYCNRNLTDGYIPWSVARKLVAWEFLGPMENHGATIYRVAVVTVDDDGDDVFDVIDRAFVVDILVRVGLWRNEGSGYRVHDYEQYQPTKAQVEADRAAKVAAGQAGGIAAARARAKAPAKASATAPAQAQSKPVPVPVPVPVESRSTAPSELSEARERSASGSTR